MTTLAFAIRGVLRIADPRAKVMATRALVRDWRLGRLQFAFDCPMPDRPARPERPELLAPSRMPKRGRGQSERGRIALWHALAHIEFVAIDLALDIVGRFGGQMDRSFADDFLKVAADESMHFALIARKLRSLGATYGDLPAHDGLWESAFETRHDVMARLAVVPMVLEARGLDVTPQAIVRMEGTGDDHGVRLLKRILDDEIVHVRFGAKHFAAGCARIGESPENAWIRLVKQHFKGRLKPPFNDSARESAGLSRPAWLALASV